MTKLQHLCWWFSRHKLNFFLKFFFDTKYFFKKNLKKNLKIFEKRIFEIFFAAQNIFQKKY